MSVNDVAICVRCVDYSDTSQIVTLFTKEHGKISAIAKGAKRKKSAFDGPIELFSYGDITFIDSSTSQLVTLSEFVQKPVFLPLRRKLMAMNCAMFGAELVSEFVHDNDPHTELFDVFINYLEDVQFAQSDREAISLLIIFQITLLSVIGTGLALKGCVNCSVVFSDKWQRAYFSSTANGLVCPDCEAAFADKQGVLLSSAAAMADLKLLQDANVQTLRSIEKVLIYHLTELLHKPPRMAKHFLQ